MIWKHTDALVKLSKGWFYKDETKYAELQLVKS